jgi:predicted aspartyl protease
MTVKINNSNVDFLIDTGSSINILDENTFKKIGSKPKLSHSNKRVFAYGSGYFIVAKIIVSYVIVCDLSTTFRSAYLQLAK